VFSAITNFSLLRQKGTFDHLQVVLDDIINKKTRFMLLNISTVFSI